MSMNTLPHTITLTGSETAYILKLLNTGLYGQTFEEVAERLIAEQLLKLIQARILTPQTKELRGPTDGIFD